MKNPERSSNTSKGAENSTPTTPKQPLDIFPKSLSRDQIIDITNITNSTSVLACNFGYLLSASQGVGRLYNPASPPVWTAGAMSLARASYNFNASALSLGRVLTTFPENRENPEARSYAQISRGLSAASVVHGAAIMFGNFLGPKGFKLYAKNGGFNGTSIIGTAAAISSTLSERKETESILNKNTKILAKQEGISEETALKIAKSTLPHITADEFIGKHFAYGLSVFAALGGLADNIPLIKEHYPQKYKKISEFAGEKTLKFASRWGGPVNGVGYALAFSLYASMVWRGHDSDERRLAKHFDNDFKPIHAKGPFDAGLTILAIGGAVLALKRGKIPSTMEFKELFSRSNSTFYERINARVSFAGNMVLNKLDCLMVGGIGAAAILNNPKQDIDTSLLSTSGNSRRKWAGPRMGISNDAYNYLTNTDQSLSKKERDKFINEQIDAISHKLPPGYVDKLSINGKRDLLENGRYRKIKDQEGVSSYILANKHENSPDTRLLHPGANFAAEMRKKATDSKAKVDSHASKVTVSRQKQTDMPPF